MSAGGGDLGPAGTPAPFAVTAPPELTLLPDRTGTTTFTVTNLTGRPVKARLMPQGGNGADSSWISVVGPTEVPMGVAATITATLRVVVPPTAPGGQHLLGLDIVAEDDTETVIGQSVAFTAPPPAVAPVKKKRRWLRILLIVLGALLALIGLIVVIVIAAAVIASN